MLARAAMAGTRPRRSWPELARASLAGPLPQMQTNVWMAYYYSSYFFDRNSDIKHFDPSYGLEYMDYANLMHS